MEDGDNEQSKWYTELRGINKVVKPVERDLF